MSVRAQAEMEAALWQAEKHPTSVVRFLLAGKHGLEFQLFRPSEKDLICFFLCCLAKCGALKYNRNI